MDKLFNEFPPVSMQQWIDQIKKDLKSDDLSKIIRKTIDNLQIEPFYRKENTENLPFLNSLPAKFPFLRGYKNHNKWAIRHNFIVKDLKKTVSEIENQNDREIDIIGLQFGEKFNLSENQLLELIKGHKKIAFCAFENVEDIFPMLEKFNLEQAFLNFDPFTHLAFVGKNYKSEQETQNNIEKLISNSNEKYKTIGINTHHFANAGATPAQQIAIALSIAAQYFDFATSKNIPLEKAIKNLWFTIGIGCEFFLEISKIRAFRYLYSKLIEAFDSNLKEKAITHIHGVTLKRNKTIYDSYSNMLRTSIEAFAGIVANVDSLSVIPFDAIYQTPNEFSNRIAINQQIVLKNEAYADRYVDPAGGSYYVENLTNKLIETAWKLFLEIEQKGGYSKAIESNFIQNLVNEIVQKEKANVETGKTPILGTNKYPNVAENLAELKIEKPLDISDLKKENSTFTTLKTERLAENFEQLRQKTEKSKKIPKVFMLTYGNTAMRRARADFSLNFFAVAGFKVIDNLGFDTVEAGIEAAMKENADIIVLCSSDEEYTSMAQKCSTLNNKIIVVAGNPASRPEIEAIGIKNFIHVKSNLFAELANYQKLLNI